MKKYVPTERDRQWVETMAACGTPQEEMCKAVNISLKTLRKAFRTELDTSATKANANVAQSLYRKALGKGMGSVTAAIFWLKTRAGWKETDRLEMTDGDGQPIKSPWKTRGAAWAYLVSTLDLNALSEETVEHLKAVSDLFEDAPADRPGSGGEAAT